MKSRYKICCVIIILVIILYVIINSNLSEAFLDNPVPSFCGTAGIKQSDAIIKFLKDIIGQDLSKQRSYTLSECNKLENGIYNNKQCLKLKDTTKDDNGHYKTNIDNIDINYSEKCIGLNTSFQTPLPSECMVDGKPLGKPNLAYSSTMGGKQILVNDNTLRLYTKNECDLLKGKFISQETSFKQTHAPADEISKAIQINGKEYGSCTKDDLEYSLLCTIDGPPSLSKDVTSSLKKHAMDWILQ